jgi:hypothetical protein
LPKTSSPSFSARTAFGEATPRGCAGRAPTFVGAPARAGEATSRTSDPIDPSTISDRMTPSLAMDTPRAWWS